MKAIVLDKPRAHRDGTLPTDLIGRPQAAEICGVHPNTMITWEANGVFPFPVYHIGPRGDRKYRLKDLYNWIESQGRVTAKS
jgi:hypothetical protein